MEIARKIPEKLAGRAFRRFNRTLNSRVDPADSTTDHIKGPIAILGFIFFGSYSALIWTLRNYETWRERLTIKPLAGLLFLLLQGTTMTFLILFFGAFLQSWVVSLGLLGAALNMIALISISTTVILWELLVLLFYSMPAILLGFETELLSGNFLPAIINGEWKLEVARVAFSETPAAIGIAVIAYVLILGAGLVEAFKQRISRDFAWATRAQNETFLAQHGLYDLDAIGLRDQDSTKYVQDAIREDHVEYYVFGTPDRRMLLTLNPASGGFSEWGKLDELRPNWAEERAAADAKPKGLRGKRAKFPRGPATKKSIYPFKRYGWNNRQ